MKFKFVFLLLTFAAVPYAFSASLEELVEPAYAASLRSGGVPVTETQLKNPALKLVPKHSGLRQFANGAYSSLDPSLAVETLYLYKKPAYSEASAGWNDAQKAGLFNQVLALSTLAGIQYYSASRKAMRTFYESSRVVDGPETKNPLSDPVYERPPASLTLYARQKDLTFGDNIYRYDFVTTGDAFFFTQENVTSMNAGIIPAIGKNKLRTVMAIIDCGDSLLIYAVSMAKAASIPGMGDRIGNSFGNRAEAILKWFTGRADSIFH
jgi:hypothetical protein